MPTKTRSTTTAKKTTARSAAKKTGTRAARDAAAERIGIDVPRTVAGGLTRILNCIPSTGTESDFLFRHAAQSGVLAAGQRAIPPGKDLREPWWDVGDQGATGACVGWASAEGVLRWHFVKAGRLAPDVHLSPRFIWMAAKETDQYTALPTTFIDSDGTFLKAALDVARKWGAVDNTVLPFEGALYAGEVATFYAISTQLKIASYFNLGIDLAAWRSWLAKKGPILTRLEVDKTWDDATSTNGRMATYRPRTARGGHAVAIVGYTRTGFIVRNSWGTGWGDEGFGYPTDAYAGKAFSEAYGVTL
jgi:hypothetical protein